MKLVLNKNLQPIKDDACLRIDQGAEAFRLNFITPGDGQTIAYQQKVRECEAIFANPEVSLGEIPHLVMEAEVSGVTPFEKAVEIITIFRMWQNVSSKIEAIRLSSKAIVASSVSIKEIEEVSNVDWASLLVDQTAFDKLVSRKSVDTDM